MLQLKEGKRNPAQNKTAEFSAVKLPPRYFEETFSEFFTKKKKKLFLLSYLENLIETN